MPANSLAEITLPAIALTIGKNRLVGPDMISSNQPYNLRTTLLTSWACSAVAFRALCAQLR